MFNQFLRRGPAVALAIAGVAGLVACGDDDSSSQSASTSTTPRTVSVAFTGSPETGLPTEYPPPKKAPLKIGLLNPSRSTEVLTVMFDAAKAEVESLGGTTIELDAKLNPDNQVSQFQQLLNEKVDAIGMYAIAGPNVLGPLLQRATKAGVPVIGFDVSPGKPGPVPGFASQIWQQRDRLVYLQVKAAAERLPKGSEVAIIGLALPVPLFQYTAQRQRTWAKKFGLKVVGQADSKNDTTVGGEEAATTLLNKYPQIKGILGYNDEPAVGAGLAARAAGRRDVETFGITAGSLGRGSIENGRLTASVKVDAEDMGRKLAQGLYDVAQRVKVPPVVLAGDPAIVGGEAR